MQQSLMLKSLTLQWQRARKWGTAMHCFDGMNTTNVYCMSYNCVHIYMVSVSRYKVSDPISADESGLL